MDRRSFLTNLGLVAVASGASSGATYWLVRPRRVPPKGIYVQMGTSITAGLHAPGANLTPITVGSRLNLTTVNFGFDGAYTGQLNDPVMDHFSLCALADALTSGDWASQDKAVTALDPLYLPRLSGFKALDFNKVTYLALEYGPNEFTLGMPIGVNSDTTRQTYKGSLNYSIKRLLTSFPLLRLFLIAPAWKLNVEDLDSDSRPNPSGLFLREYVDATIEIAALNHIPCLDMWRTLGLGVNNYKAFTFDGTHPNEAGAIRRGEAIAAFISSVFEPK